jgi:hypothetical protein
MGNTGLLPRGEPFSSQSIRSYYCAKTTDKQTNLRLILFSAIDVMTRPLLICREDN